MIQTIIRNACLTTAALCIAFSASAVSAQQTSSVATDPRIKYIGYAKNSIYGLNLFLKSVTAVQFSDDEQIESILIGDRASWEVVKLD